MPQSAGHSRRRKEPIAETKLRTRSSEKRMEKDQRRLKKEAKEGRNPLPNNLNDLHGNHSSKTATPRSPTPRDHQALDQPQNRSSAPDPAI